MQFSNNNHHGSHLLSAYSEPGTWHTLSHLILKTVDSTGAVTCLCQAVGCHPSCLWRPVPGPGWLTPKFVLWDQGWWPDISRTSLCPWVIPFSPSLAHTTHTHTACHLSLPWFARVVLSRMHLPSKFSAWRPPIQISNLSSPVTSPTQPRPSLTLCDLSTLLWDHMWSVLSPWEILLGFTVPVWFCCPNRLSSMKTVTVS